MLTLATEKRRVEECCSASLILALELTQHAREEEKPSMNPQHKTGTLNPTVTTKRCM